MLRDRLLSMLELLKLRLCCRLDRAHGLAEGNGDDLSVANVLKQDLRVADDQRVSNVQLILHELFVHVLNVDVLALHAVTDWLDCTHSSYGRRDDGVLLLRVVRRGEHVLLVEGGERIQVRLVVVDAGVGSDVLSRDLYVLLGMQA